MAINHLIHAATSCTKREPRFAYIAPTYVQGKNIAWDYLQHFALAIPGTSANASELRLDFPNGGRVRIYGADNPDSLRGIYLDGVVLDEYGLMPSKTFTEVIRPALSDRQGWAVFIGTPNGKNEFYEVCKTARMDSAGWYFAEFRASDTGLLDERDLASARAQMTPEEYAQEFECSFEASVKGAIYAREIATAHAEGRVTRVPYDPGLLVDTDWDLGIGDNTAIWFTQSLTSGEVRVIDYYEAAGYGLQHYVDVLSKRGYVYGMHYAPHDIEQREFTSGLTRLESARRLGLHLTPIPRVKALEDGIHAARMLFPRCWFDRDKCADGLDLLSAYKRDFNARIQEHVARPVHDHTSHAADAFRGLATRHYTPAWRPEAKAAAALKRAQQDSDPFRWAPQRGGRGGY